MHLGNMAPLLFAASSALLCTRVSADPTGVVGSAYTMTNAPDGNEVLAYDRMADGSLVFSTAHSTGGLGSGDGLGNQGGVVLSENGRWLLVVNAGSHEVSLFSTRGGGGFTLADSAPSGGVRPVSVALHGRLVYVLHAGGAAGDVDTISALTIGPGGTLSPVPGSSRSLSEADTAPAQVGFSPDGRFLVVTEKATSTVDVFPVLADGTTGPPAWNASVGQTPFAFGFDVRGHLFVSEVFGGAEDAGAVSSYSVRADGSLEVIDGSVPNTETAPCWLVVTKGGRYAFTTNTPDDSLSAYAIDSGGYLELVDADGRTGEPGQGTLPLDMDLSDDGRFLYTLNVGDRTISTFRVMPDGSLVLLGAVAGLPNGANGLAAR